jgi:BON domain
MSRWPLIAVAMASAVAPRVAADDEERANFFNDPFMQVTDAIKTCPRQEAPAITHAQMRAEMHGRAERGTSCYQSGRCRLPNAYLYDSEIIPRVRKAILADGRFANTSVWVEGQRRWVWLKGCVGNQEQAMAIEQLVRNIDDVEAVINQLSVVGR